MTECTVARISGACDWLRVRRLYKRAFPASERKPLSAIAAMRRRGKADVWCFRQNGRFAGFATTVNGDGLIMIDYLAVEPSARNQGVGTQALTAICRAYPGMGVFVEIEDTSEPCDNQRERFRRRAFYERCGFAPTNTVASTFGTRFELLCRDCTVDFAAYHAFYCTQIGAWAGEHIQPAPRAEAT